MKAREQATWVLGKYSLIRILLGNLPRIQGLRSISQIRRSYNKYVQFKDIQAKVEPHRDIHSLN